MSTIACASIQVTDAITGFPSSWLSVDGAIFLELGEDFDIPLGKQAEELTEVNDLQTSGVFGFGIPKTPLNQFVLRDWIDPNTFDFSPTPVNVIAYSGGTVLTQKFLYVRESRWRDQTIECALVNDPSHWMVGASRLKLNQIEYDDFVYSQFNVGQNMMNDHQYTDGDPGIYFQMSNYGNLYTPNRINVEYLRPWYHLLRLLRQGFRQIGWKFVCPILETDVGRQWISYLINPNFFTEGVANKTLLANISPLTIQQIYTNNDVNKPRIENLFYDMIIDDPTGGYNEGRFFGFGEYIVEASLNWYGFYQVFHTVTIEIVTHDGLGGEPNVVTSKKGGNKNDNATVASITVKSENAITLLPGQWLEIRYYGESNGVSSWTDNIVAGSLKITPVKAFPIEGETINPGLMLRPDPLIDLCKGVLHLMRGKTYTEFDCKTVTFFPNFMLEYYGEEVEGFYTDGVVNTIDDLQVFDSEISRPPDYNTDRFLLIGFKSPGDNKVKKVEAPLTYPLHSKLADLGEDFKDGTTENLNPYFEPTANDWVNFSKVDNGIPLDLPHLLDHDPDPEKVQISINIQPRVIITKGWTEVVYKGSEGTDHTTDYDFGNYLVVVGSFSSYPWGFNLSLGYQPDGERPEENLVYGELDNDLYNLLWKRWIFENFRNFTVDLLVFMHTRDFSSYDLRSTYAFLVGGKRSFGFLLAINQFQACRQIPTQMILNVAAATVGQYPTEPDQEDPCDTYTYELSYTEVAGVYTFTVTTDSPGAITIQWRYFDGSWTTGNVVTNPDRLFYVRVLDGACNDRVVIIQPFDPCGNNSPVLLFAYRYDEDTMEHCVTISIGGILEDAIDTVDLEVSIDGGAAAQYTIDTEICGATEDFCATGEIQFLNDCPPIPIEGCFEVPPVIVDCTQNLPSVGYASIGLDTYQLLLAGSIVSPPSAWWFEIKDVGADELTLQIWDRKSPVSGKTVFQARIIMLFCDTCPQVCSPWVTIPTPMEMRSLADKRYPNEWDFSEMTADDWQEVIRMLQRGDEKGLMKMHNDKKLSGAHLCCGKDGKGAVKWFNYGLRLFKRSSE